MYIANYEGRAILLNGDRWYDVERCSAGAFPSSPRALVTRLGSLAQWASDTDLTNCATVSPLNFGPPIPNPRQIFATGLNYHGHVAEMGLDLPTKPPIFTKFQSSLAGSTGELKLPTDTVDWEAELVVAIASETRNVDVSEALSKVAGFMIGQDFSDRGLQFGESFHQHCLSKSYPGFSPIGPYLVTLDEIPDVTSLTVRTKLVMDDGAQMVVQEANTADFIFDVPTLISELSRMVTLYPGDIIFTGTPSGVGMGRKPPMYLRPGWSVETEISGLGTMLQHCVCDV